LICCSGNVSYLPSATRTRSRAKGTERYISTDHIRVPFRTKLVMMKLCQSNCGAGSCGLCIVTDAWCGWGTDVGAVEFSVTSISLLQSALWNIREGGGRTISSLIRYWVGLRRPLGRRRVNHQQEALLSGRQLWNIMIGMSSPNVLLHRPKSLLLLCAVCVSACDARPCIPGAES
jgi:hypothetical protein